MEHIGTNNVKIQMIFFCGAVTQRGSWPPHSRGFLDHTQRRTTVGRTPLDEWSARRRDLYLKTHNTHKRQISMPPVGFEPTISAGERSQTYTLDRAATGTGTNDIYIHIYIYMLIFLQMSITNYICNCFLLLLLFFYYVSCHRPILPGNSLEPIVIPSAQASSFTLQYFPYYVWCSKYSCLL